MLSQGRAWLGIGAAWYEREHLGLGWAFPPLGERYERLEEAIRICIQMWSDDDGPFTGTHYQLAETLCSPRPIQQPRPPIMVAGSGERKTLRLVARYADQCNVRGDSPEGAKRLFAILGEHCEAEGTDYEAIERTVTMRFDPGPEGERAAQVVEKIGELADAGAHAVLGSLQDAGDPRVMEAMGRLVIPQVAEL